MRLHEEHHKWFSGRLGLPAADRIAILVKEAGAKTLLDYGSGKGYQYLKDRIHERWGGILPICYDIGVEQLEERPTTKFDGVICTDVMEHIATEDVHTILRDIFGYVKAVGFVYFAICCRPAVKEFADGTNVHLTVRHPNWWRTNLLRYKRPGLIVEDEYEYVKDYGGDDVQSERVRGLRS